MLVVKTSSRRKASSKKAMSAVKCIFAADDISQMKRVNEDPVASPSIVFVSLSFHCSRSRQLLKCSLWCHGKHSEFLNSRPITTAAFLPRIGKGLILFYSTPITCVTVTQSIQCPSYCTWLICVTAILCDVPECTNIKMLRLPRYNRARTVQPWWHCSATQRVCSLPESQNWKLADLKGIEEHILPPAYGVYCSLLSWFQVFRNSRERWCQGKTKPYPCKPFEWRVWIHSLIKVHILPGSLNSCFQVHFIQAHSSILSSLHTLACSYGQTHSLSWSQIHVIQ